LKEPTNNLLLVLKAEHRELIGDPADARAEVIDRLTVEERE
jgi:hypothetical protein